MRMKGLGILLLAMTLIALAVWGLIELWPYLNSIQQVAGVLSMPLATFLFGSWACKFKEKPLNLLRFAYIEIAIGLVTPLLLGLRMTDKKFDPGVKDCLALIAACFAVMKGQEDKAKAESLIGQGCTLPNVGSRDGVGAASNEVS